MQVHDDKFYFPYKVQGTRVSFPSLPNESVFPHLPVTNAPFPSEPIVDPLVSMFYQQSASGNLVLQSQP